MSNERPEEYRDERDPRVSGAYRDLARERPGATLDEAVLREARQSARRGLARTARWFRPLAWTAMIGLCLAIVIEVSQLPHDGAIEADGGFAGPAEPAEPAAPRQDATAPPPGNAKAESDDAGPAALGTASSPELQNLRMLREAEERARAQSGNAPEPASLRFAPATPEAADAERHCSEDETADPNRWLECILELERDGLHAEAQAERQRLRETFPPPDGWIGPPNQQ